ncbi:MAG: hypothetical protein JNM20_19100 [Rhizobiales bacterium]|nr:hypothetical protein [Hyphomicrobiales bacterium]
MTFLFSTSQDKELKGILVAELRAQVSPLLESLGFKVFRPRKDRHKGFPTNYYRLLANRIDVISFQWRTHGRPAFIIDFDVINDLSKFTSLAQEGSETWFNAPRYRAQANKGRYSERWFHIGYLPRLLDLRRAARKEVENACARIREIDEFAKTGHLSRYLRDLRPGEGSSEARDLKTPKTSV